MRQLDLHGVAHCDVRRTVQEFVLLNQDQFPLLIITGNSVHMHSLVSAALHSVDVVFDTLRQGTVSVYRFR